VREKLNENPIAQVAVVLVLIAVAAFMLLKPGGGGGEEAAPEASVSVGGTEMSQSEVASKAGEVVEGAVEAVIESGALAGASGGAAEMPTSVPAPPPPHAFTAAYDSGRTVVLLVVHDGGIDDRLTARAASILDLVPQAKLITVPVKQLPRYAAVTVGLDVSRVPALVVMKPKRLSGGTPQATVDYGFQTAESILLAVSDANYHGPEATYHPE
jgi:hypothetical protein